MKSILERTAAVVALWALGAVTVFAQVADTPHVRCIYNGSCGSGTICGANANGAYVVTNAHVVGTAIGRTVSVDIVVDGAQRRINGRTVMAGYSSSRMVDFSIVFCQGLTSKRYMPMLKTEPTGQPYGTRGSPRCVWPQVTKEFNDPRNYGDGLITGTPNAIGGQSGSAIYNAAGQQIALLTWSINGRCAGQKTSKLWQVAQSRNVMLADPRPEGLEEVCDDQPEGTRPETRDGVFGSLAEVSEQTGPRPVTENVIASITGSDMEELPIWYEPNTDPPTEPGECPPGCMRLTDKEKALIEFIRAQAAQQ